MDGAFLLVKKTLIWVDVGDGSQIGLVGSNQPRKLSI